MTAQSKGLGKRQYSHLSKGILSLCFFLFLFSFNEPPYVFGESEGRGKFLTKQELAWLDNHPVIRLAPDPQFQPIEFIDENGNYSGIGADFVKLLEQKLGIKFEIVVCADWDEVISRTRKREVDVLNAVVRTPEREAFLTFPPPYLTLPSVILVQKNVSETLTLEKLKGMHIVMVSGYGYVDLIRHRYPDIRIELVSDLKTALRKVSFSMADAFVGDLATASYCIESQGIINLKIAGETDPPNISGFAVRSDWPELVRILDKGISQISEKERSRIMQKWIYLETEPKISAQQLQNLILLSVLGIILLSTGFLLWNLMLKRVVQNRTKDLQREVKERKLAETALLRSEKRFRALAETSPLAIYMSVGIEQRGVYMNAAFTRLFGYTLDEIPSISDWWPLAYPDEENRESLKEEWQSKVSTAIESKTEIDPMEVVVTCKDGSKKNISWGFISIGEENWAFGMDLTERVQQDRKRALLEAQLHQAQKMEAMGALAGGIAHDFNNILAAILGNAELALLQLSENPGASQKIKQVVQASYRARDLIKQILAFSRKEQTQEAPIELYPVIREALELLRASIPATINMEEDLDSHCGVILADPIQIHQVVMNLCTNAAQSMEENGGILRIELKAVQLDQKDLEDASNMNPGRYARLSVKDNGKGIEKQYLDRIFDPFFTTKEVGKGSGMGLAVVTGIVKNCGAMIRVSSQNGTGTSFHVYFPLLEEYIIPENRKSENLSTGNERILVVDDEKTIINIISQYLEQMGYQVTAFTNSQEAFEVFRSNPFSFDLILTDQTMPGLTGDKLARLALEIRPEIPVILCSGYSSRISTERARNMGIREFLMKPVTMKKLSQIVRTALDA